VSELEDSSAVICGLDHGDWVGTAENRQMPDRSLVECDHDSALDVELFAGRFGHAARSLTKREERARAIDSVSIARDRFTRTATRID
jgi:hypothetical protein